MTTDVTDEEPHAVVLPVILLQMALRQAADQGTAKPLFKSHVAHAYLYNQHDAQDWPGSTIDDEIQDLIEVVQELPDWPEFIPLLKNAGPDPRQNGSAPRTGGPTAREALTAVLNSKDPRSAAVVLLEHPDRASLLAYPADLHRLRQVKGCGKLVDDILSRAKSAQRVAARTRKPEASEADAVAASVAELGGPAPEVDAALLKRQSPFGEEVYVVRCLANVVRVLTADPRFTGRIRRDVFLGVDLFDSERLTDATVAAIACWLTRVYDLDVGPSTVHEAVGAVAAHNAFDSAVEWFDALPEWDGVPRLDDLFPKYFGVDVGDEAELAAAYGRCIPISIVARVYEPGCQSDSAGILGGRKGLRKSTGWRALCPKVEWYGDSMLPIGDKDAYTVIAGKLMWELGELESVTRRDLAAVKAFMTSKEDTFRPPYGRCDVHRLRRCTFVGTVNSDSDPTFLREPDRRWWPMRVVRMVDTAAITRDHAQLWAEARHRYRAGEPWHLDGKLVQAQDESVSAYVQADPWEEPIRAWLEYTDAVVTTYRPWVRAEEVLQHACGIPPVRATKADLMRVTQILSSRFKYENRKTTEDEDGAKVRGRRWWRP